MGTTTYFEKYVDDSFSKKPVRIEAGTTGYAENGPQMYLKIGNSEVLLSHNDAKQFCEGIKEIARYLGY